MHIGIIGAGHAGIEAAVAARATGASVTVYSNEPVLPYFRPRLVAVAMGQVAADEIAMHPADWYAERGIRLCLATPVGGFDPDAHSVTAGGATERFDALVLACGAMPLRPLFSGETPDLPVGTLWSQADARAMLPRIQAGGRLVVVGGGILGIECALRARERGLRVALIEKLPRLFPRLLGDAAAALLRAQLEAKGVTIHTACAVAEVGGMDTLAQVRLDDATRLEAEFVLVCIGARPNLELARLSGLAAALGVVTDAHLQARPGVFVAGDVCQVGERPAPGSVRESSAQGRLAGANAAAWIAGLPMQAFTFAPAPVGLRYSGIELWAAGSCGGQGTNEQRLDDGSRTGVYQAVSRCGARTVGVQMIGTREGFDELAQTLAL